MKYLTEHARRFHGQVAREPGPYQDLHRGQRPQALMIACTDSRIQPSLVTGAGPGDLLELRTVGNIVPAYRLGSPCGTAATVEFAVAALSVPAIVVMGHSGCEGVAALMDRRAAARMPLLDAWLDEAAYCSPETPSPSAGQVRAAELEHLLNQVANLCTLPVVARARFQERLAVHAWHYDVATGRIQAWHPQEQEWLPL
nr:carbonic anhydrase [Kitasatospora purpeofusca]